MTTYIYRNYTENQIITASLESIKAACCAGLLCNLPDSMIEDIKSRYRASAELTQRYKESSAKAKQARRVRGCCRVTKQ